MSSLAKYPKAALCAACLLLGIAMLTPVRVVAHCDGLDGPVVAAARQALEQRDVSRVLVWVGKPDEPAIRKSFEQALAVRKLNPQARELADTWFFETLVRLHRAGEGAPYTGLKPAGRNLGPAIPAADRALESGDGEPLVRLIVDAAERGLRQRFAETRAARSYPAGSVEAGRAYIARYVPFLHYTERLYEAATTSAAGHEAEGTEPARHVD